MRHQIIFQRPGFENVGLRIPVVAGTRVRGFVHGVDHDAGAVAWRNGLGFDPIWFGVYMVILVECALFTSPVGLNLYVIQSVTNLR